MPRSIFIAFLLLLRCVSAFSQQQPRAGALANEGTPTGTLRQIIPGHYVYSSSTYNIRWPQYEKLLGYDAQRETAVRRLYQQLTGKLK